LLNRYILWFARLVLTVGLSAANDRYWQTPTGRRIMLAVEERFFTVEEIAGSLQVSDQTVRRWVKSGKLAAFKPGKELRIRARDLEEFLEARKVRPGEETE